MNAPSGRTADRSAASFLGRITVPLLVILGGATAVVAAVASGATQAQVLGDPGALTRLSLPAARAVFNLSAAATIGALVVASFVLPRTPRRRKGTASADEGLDPAWAAAVRIAGIASVVWTLSSVLVMLLLYIDVIGTQDFTGFSSELGVFLLQIDTGRSWLAIILFTALVSTLCFGVRSQTGIGITAILALVTLIPLALTGHASGADNHSLAVNSIGLHIAGVTVWLGGLLTLALVSPRLTGRADLGALMRRFSALALVAYALVVFSGVVNASLRLSGPGDLASAYGYLLIAKVVLAIGLGMLGFLQRRTVIAKMDAAADAPAGTTGTRTLLWQLIGIEITLFALVSGLAVALARTPPPVPQEAPTVPTPARQLTGVDLPPRPELSSAWTQWSPDILWIVVAVGAAAAYLYGVWLMRRRGDRWPLARTISWVVGMALLVYVTSGAPAVYGRVLFSGHMVQHMILVMVVPIPMVFGAPVTLLMRAVRPRMDGSRGLREWVLVAVHSKVARFFSNPVVAGVNFAGSLVVFYYSGIMWWALSTHVGHQIMIIHFLIAGYLFAQALVGIDPGPRRPPYPLRLLVLLITMAFHAFFGISIMYSTALIEPDWFGNMGHGWISAIEDQERGGEFAWGIGEVPTLLLALTVAIQWSRSSDREAKRSDRREDRSGDAELGAYNEMLERLSKRP